MAHGLLFGHPRRARLGLWLAAAGLLPHGAAIAIRWVASGHGPYLRRYEVLSSSAWVTVGVALLLLARRPRWAPLAVVAFPAAFLMVALGLTGSPELSDLPPSLRSTWLVFHVGFAKLATGAFVLSLSSAVLLLWKARGGRGRFLDALPAAESLDASTARFAGFGFLFWTVNVGAGAIWAHQAWGRYWGWDPVETWSLVTWLCYGTFLHARRFFRLRGPATAWAAIGCFLVAVLSLFILPFAASTLHASYFQ